MGQQSQKQKLCYVIMPFSEFAGVTKGEWTETYEDFFVPAIKSAKMGYRCERSEIRNGAFIKEIIENLKNADVVLADITGFNGNVMWELGIRHALSPRTILVSREDVKGKKYISDLSTYGVVVYPTKGYKKIKTFNDEIKKILKKIDIDPEHPDNPVYDFLKVEDLVMESYEERQIKNNLTGLLTELLDDLYVCDILLKRKGLTEKNVSFYRFNLSALENLLTSNYYFDYTLHFNLYSLRRWILHSNMGMDMVSDYFNTTRNEDEVKKAVEKTKKNVETTKERIVELIKMINKILELKKLPSHSKPMSVVFDDEHKKLLDEK